MEEPFIEQDESIHQDTRDKQLFEDDVNNIETERGQLIERLPDFLGSQLMDQRVDWTNQIDNHTVSRDCWEEQKAWQQEILLLVSLLNQPHDNANSTSTRRTSRASYRWRPPNEHFHPPI